MIFAQALDGIVGGERVSGRKKSGVPASARELLRMQEFEQLNDAKKRDSRVTVPFFGAPTHFISELFALSNSESVIVSVPSL